MQKPLKIFFIIFGVFVLAGLAGAAVYYNKYLKGSGPALRGPSGDIAQIIEDAGKRPGPAVNNTEFPLKLPAGFSISVFAKNLPGARVLAMDGMGNILVSQTSQGKISLIERQTGQVTEILKNLNRPHGLAVADGNILYYAEETKISRVALYTEDSPKKIIDLPEGGRHYTRTIRFGAEDRLYVSIGSTCDVCYEEDERIAAIYSMNKDGSDFKKVASGLRNSVFFAWDYVEGKMWATEMGRDNLGDNLPPDEINVIESGKDYGWPVCYGQNIHDSNFDKNTYIQNPCNGKVPAKIELPAHSAPLGLAFIPEEPAWPEEYWGDIIVAFHGSWNRSEPTGYKLARIKLNQQNAYEGMEDFISGWLAKDGKTSLGRPVEVLALADGTMFVSDDKAGVVYKITYNSEPSPINSTTGAVKNLNIQENSEISLPLEITGEALGTWFFEASFPITLVDSNWKELGTGIAQAQGEWMTTNFVPFKAQLNFNNSYKGPGWLVFKKDNPSGLKENDAQFHFPVKIK